ncbi:MAG: leucine-rich repeat domain-containing protein [Eubacterium sp.]
MNFAKKSISFALATVMAASSLFVGTTAFAAAPQYTPTTGVSQAFTANPVVEKVEYDDDYYYSVDNNDSYFTFTPATTGTYELVLNTTPRYVLETRHYYDDEEDWYYYETNYSDTYVDGSRRCDYAWVDVYEDENLNKSVSSVSTDLRTTNYVYNKNTKEVDADRSSEAYIPGYATFNLIGGKTYYISAYANMGSKYKETASDGTPVYDYYKTQASFSIVPSDWSVYTSTKYKEIDMVLPADAEEWSYKDEAGNKHYKNEYVFDKIEASVSYTGSAKDVVVPDTISALGAIVTSVTGTSNKNITSLTLGANTKSVSGFSELKSLSSVNLNSVETIGSYAFGKDTALTSVTIPASVKTIGSSAFAYCTSLSNVVICDGVKEIDEYAFYSTALKGAIVPSTVVSIGSYALGYENNFNTNTVSPYDTTETVVEGFTLGGRSSEEASIYAAQNGIAYYDVTAGCPHPYITTTVNATLFAAGSQTSTCPLCGVTTTKTLAKKTFKIKSLTAKKASLVVKAPVQSGITGYVVEVSTSKKFTTKTTKKVTVKTTKALNKTITGLKSGKKYYVRVRATGVNANGKTVYSKYTPVKSVKVK